jgi:hypothetical protein
MLEPQDIQKLIEVLVTKEDIRDIGKQIGSIENSLSLVSERVGVLEPHFIAIDQRLVSVDD